MFLRPGFLEHDNYTIHPDWRLISDYTSLTVDISIFEKYIQTRKHMLVKNSKKEDNFINDLIEAIKEINTENIQSKEVLDQIIQSLASATERI